MTIEPLERAPRFVVVAGPPCAGKSTVARHLARALTAPHLEMDRFRARILPHSDQCVEDRDTAYNAMHLTAEMMAPWCGTVILDATYTAAVCRTALVDTIERTRGALFVIECHVEPGVAADRLDRRGAHPAVDLTPARIACLVADYPYSPMALAVRTDTGSLQLSNIVDRMNTGRLTEAAHGVWCDAGRVVRT